MNTFSNSAAREGLADGSSLSLAFEGTCKHVMLMAGCLPFGMTHIHTDHIFT